MTTFICDECDQVGHYDPSLSDDAEPQSEVCTPCQRGQGLATFYDDDVLVGRQRIPVTRGMFPGEWERGGTTYTLSDTDRMTAYYTA